MSIKTKSHISIIISDADISFLLERVLFAAGHVVTPVADPARVEATLADQTPDLFIIQEKVGAASGLELAANLASEYPAVPILLLVRQETPDLLKGALRAGVTDTLCLPLRSEQLLDSVSEALMRAKHRKDWVIIESKRATAKLQQRLDELETLTRLGRSITSTLDLDNVLTAVVDAAVGLTGAEEGSLLLLDRATGDLYMRAARNFQEDFVRTFRLPVVDSLAGNVIRSGQPVVLDEQTPQKIKTSYLVQGLLYVPLQIHGRTFGVLGVDNRESRIPFSSHHINILSALADYAVVAIENARLYADTDVERRKLGTILTQVQDGVIVIDQDGKILLVNQTVRSMFSLKSENLGGVPFPEVIRQPELHDLVLSPEPYSVDRTEVALEDGRVFSAQLTPVPDVGKVITLHDITYLKKLDRLKSEFVSTVSHDLRSPLTAILGYIELIQRVGTINELQSKYIERVLVSVRNITALVDDLLNLGRIEAGLETGREPVFFDLIVEHSVESFKNRTGEKNLDLQVQLQQEIPQVTGHPVQLRQMVDNLLDNAAKYTPSGGQVSVSLAKNGSQLILKVTDTGPGIPSADLPYVFDKFYRGGNVSSSTTGTGLGLAIVKSIVEKHQGRIWVESTPDMGTTFTVVLPVNQAG